MPTSPDTVVEAWLPTELVAASPATSAASVASARRAAGSVSAFEVSPTAGIPPAMLKPARDAAESAGYAAGWAKGISAAHLVGAAELRAARERGEREAHAARGQVEQALSAVQAAAGSLGNVGMQTHEVEALIVDYAFEIAEAVIGASVRDDPDRGARAVARALADVPDGDQVTITLNPADHEILLATGAGVPDNVRLAVDDTLAPGDAVAVSGSATIDARIGAGLVRVREVLGR